MTQQRYRHPAEIDLMQLAHTQSAGSAGRINAQNQEIERVARIVMNPDAKDPTLRYLSHMPYQEFVAGVFNGASQIIPINGGCLMAMYSRWGRFKYNSQTLLPSLEMGYRVQMDDVRADTIQTIRQDWLINHFLAAITDREYGYHPPHLWVTTSPLLDKSREIVVRLAENDLLKVPVAVIASRSHTHWWAQSQLLPRLVEQFGSEIEPVINLVGAFRFVTGLMDHQTRSLATVHCLPIGSTGDVAYLTEFLLMPPFSQPSLIQVMTHKKMNHQELFMLCHNLMKLLRDKSCALKLFDIDRKALEPALKQFKRQIYSQQRETLDSWLMGLSEEPILQAQSTIERSPSLKVAD